MSGVASVVGLISHDIISGRIARSDLTGNSITVMVNGQPKFSVDLLAGSHEYHTVRDQGSHIDFELKTNLPLGPDTLTIEVVDGQGKLLPGGKAVLKPLTTRVVSDYIQELKVWLDKRFSRAGFVDGWYYGHQPVYGFRKGHSEPNWHDRYIISYAIIRKLAHLKFASFLDAGGAEGYKAALVKDVFGADVTSCDLSQEACNRAQDLYQIKTAQIDLHKLQFADESYDVVLASETIEHVFDHTRAIDELLRVAKKAVIITVPHETPEQVADAVKREELHGHIHYFDTKSFNYLRERGYQVYAEPILSLQRMRRALAVLMEADMERVRHYRSPLARLLVRLTAFLFKPIFNQKVASAFMEGDHASAAAGRYAGVVAVIVKDSTAWSDQPLRPVSMEHVTGFATAPLTVDSPVRPAVV